MSKRRQGDDNWYGSRLRRPPAAHEGPRHHRAQSTPGASCSSSPVPPGSTTPSGGSPFSPRTLIDIKSIVYEMRFDPVSVRYGEFGDFYIGMQMPLDELFRRLCV